MRIKNLKKTAATIAAGLTLAGFNMPTCSAEPTWSENSAIGQSLNLPICEWKDDTVPTKAIIFAIHGATLYAKTFNDVAKHFSSEGYPFYALDMRGYGRWRKESSVFGGDAGIHYTQTKGDMLEALGALRRTYPDTKIYILGESLGANLAIWLVTNKPELADGAILSSPCIKRIMHPQWRMIAEVPTFFFNPYKDYDMKPHIEPYLSDDKRVTQHYMADPMINRFLSCADLLKSMRTNREALLGADKMGTHVPLLVVAGQLDQVYSAKAIPDFMKRAGSQDKTVYIEPTKGHLLLETTYTEPKILKEIDAWLTQEISAKHPGDNAVKTSADTTNSISAAPGSTDAHVPGTPEPTGEPIGRVVNTETTVKMLAGESKQVTADQEAGTPGFNQQQAVVKGINSSSD